MSLEVGRVVASPRGTRVEVKENSPERYVMERHLPPGTGKTPPHIHQNGVERFEVSPPHAGAAAEAPAKVLGWL